MKSTQILALVSALGSLASAATAAAQARFDTLYSFTNGFPVGFVAANGVLFGGFQGLGETGVYCGTVFELKPPAAGGGAWTQDVLYSFAGADTDGCVLALPPVWANGALYGTTVEQGAYDMGVVYELQPPGSAGGEWTESVLYNFSPPGTKVGYAVGNLIPSQGGSFYLLTSSGVYGYGALTRLQPPEMPGGVWNPALLYSFPKLAPAWSLTEGDGVFYATTLYGPDDSGLILQLTPPAAPGETWTETHLYALAFGQGATPNSLTLAEDGTLYGTTYGTNEFGNGPGTVFSLTPPASPGGDWTYALLENFEQYHPNVPLILRGGKLYGAVVAGDGGAGNDGAIFELQPPATPGSAWTLTWLHRFTGGEQPGGTLLMDDEGTLYGATQNYLQPASGTIYRLATR